MQVVLVVDPASCVAESLSQHLGWDQVAIQVADAKRAVAALHALQFAAVLVPFGKARERAYEALFSTMRLVAPLTRLVFVPSASDAQGQDLMAPAGQGAAPALTAPRPVQCA